jgi:hypothetical protein
MKKIFIQLIAVSLAMAAHTQESEVAKIMDNLSNLNQEVVSKKCEDATHMIVTHRGLNHFFADKIGSYLSESGDISLFKNYATLNTSGGEFSINRNFGKIQNDGPLAPLTAIGLKTRISEGFAAIFSGESFSNDLGLLFKRTWFGRGTTSFGNCPNEINGVKDNRPTQKALMNAKRSFILHNLEVEMTNKAQDFEAVLSKMRGAEFDKPDELRAAKEGLRTAFYKNLSREYIKKFAEQESKALGSDSSYNMMTTHWTTITVYVPVTTQKFSIAPSVNEAFVNEQLYPWKVNFNYSEIMESQNAGRIILYFDAGIFQNNSVNTRSVDKIKLTEYKNRGGTDTVHFAELDTEEAFVGAYHRFITPFTKLQLVWFPKSSNAGVSLQIEKNFGKFDPFNARIGMPIRFNDRNGNPNVNFELQLRASDLNKAVNSNLSFGKRLSIGFSVGLPFSNKIY